MPLRAYPPRISALLATYYEEAVRKLKEGHAARFAVDEANARMNVLDGMLDAYDNGERREERLIAAALRRFFACHWPPGHERFEESQRDRRKESAGDVHTE